MNPRDGLAKLQKRQCDEFERSTAIAREIRERPDRDYAEIGARYRLTAGRVAQIAVKFKVRRRRSPKQKPQNTKFRNPAEPVGLRRKLRSPGYEKTTAEKVEPRPGGTRHRVRGHDSRLGSSHRPEVRERSVPYRLATLRHPCPDGDRLHSRRDS